MTDEELDRLLLALDREGFTLPFGPARIADFPGTGTDTPEGLAQIARLRAADDASWKQNRAALREVLAATEVEDA